MKTIYVKHPKLVFVLSLLWLGTFGCAVQKPSYQVTEETGVLYINNIRLLKGFGKISILNLDSSLFCEISDSVKFPNHKLDFPLIYAEGIDHKDKVRIMTLFPEYGLFHISCKGLSHNHFKVEVNEQEKLIPIDSVMTKLISWERHLKRSFVMLDTAELENVRSNINGDPIKLPKLNHKEYVFEVKEVKGEWIRISCLNNVCYSCPVEASKIKGWLRWRRYGQHIVDLRYTC